LAIFTLAGRIVTAIDLVDVGNQSGDFKFPCGDRRLNHPMMTGKVQKIMKWAPVHQGIAGPVIFGLRRISGTHQLFVEIRKRLAFAPWSRVDV
jgi:hypothetical protein